MGLKKRPCSTSRCDGVYWAKGMCKNCYMRFHRNGTVEMQNKPKPVMERFWKFVNKTRGCWLWTGSLSTDGYGRILGDKKRGSAAHRVIYEMINGKIPEGLEIDHLCGRRNCVNPEHLEAVTHKENVRRGANAQKPLCINGHEFDIVKRNGQRGCSVCNRDRANAFYYQNKERHREYQRRYQRKRRAALRGERNDRQTHA
jgi:HNH endonuclease